MLLKADFAKSYVLVNKRITISARFGKSRKEADFLPIIASAIATSARIDLDFGGF